MDPQNELDVELDERHDRRYYDKHPLVVDKKVPLVTVIIFMFGLVGQTVYFTWSLSSAVTQFQAEIRNMKEDIEDNKKAITSFTVLNNKLIAVEVTVNNMRDTLEDINAKLDGTPPRRHNHNSSRP